MRTDAASILALIVVVWSFVQLGSFWASFHERCSTSPSSSLLDLESKSWSVICDLMVIEKNGTFQLQDVLNISNEVSVRRQGTTEDVHWSTLQPTERSKRVMQGLPHLQTESSYMIVTHGFELDSNTDWILTFAGARLPDSSGFNIIFGPSNQCNCQIRYEEENTLGLYATNSGYGLNSDRPIALPHDNTHFHVLTLRHHKEWVTIYQNSTIVDKIELGQFWAEFAYIGTWFKGEFASEIIVHRIAFLKGGNGDDTLDMDELVRRMSS